MTSSGSSVKPSGRLPSRTSNWVRMAAWIVSNSGRVPKLQLATSEEKQKMSMKRIKKCQMSFMPARIVPINTPVRGWTAVALMIRTSMRIMMKNPAFWRLFSWPNNPRIVSTAEKNASILFCTVSELSRNGTLTKSVTNCFAFSSDRSCIAYLTAPYVTSTVTWIQSYTTSPSASQSHPTSGNWRRSRNKLMKSTTLNTAVIAARTKKIVHSTNAVSRCPASRNPMCWNWVLTAILEPSAVIMTSSTVVSPVRGVWNRHRMLARSVPRSTNSTALRISPSRTRISLSAIE
mmetsp:Transcript_28747/g.68149  ORF Transcript_28747/g.68149 Transcript_28747/m.68149 type:complete len:290 (-) Transcript_28747:4301-5170(-)